MRRRYILAALYGPDRSFIRQITPSVTRCNLRWNAISTAQLTLPDTHPAIGDVLDDGTRAAVHLVTDENGTVTSTRLLEGPVGDTEGNGPFGTVTFPVQDDFAWLWSILGWQVPAAGIGSQDTAEYRRYGGPSESRALAAIDDAVTRLSLPWDVPTTAQRGSTGTTEYRMHSLGDRVLAPLIADRLQLVIERNPTTDRWEVEIREGTVYSRPLTPQSGVLGKWKWKQQRPTMTRVVVGGAGQGTDREFDLIIDSTLETAIGRILEGFDDSRMADVAADLTPYGDAALAAAAAKAGVTAELRETSWFQFPTAYQLGTQVTVQAGAMSATDVVTEIEISHDNKSGLTVVPKIGLTTEDPSEQLVQFVAGLATQVRNLEKG